MIDKDLTISEKDMSIQNLVKKVERLDQNGTVSTVNRWEAALCAIGFTNINRPERIVYVCSEDNEQDHFYYECEIDGDDPDDDVTVESEDNASTEKVLNKIQEFLIDLEG